MRQEIETYSIDDKNYAQYVKNVSNRWAIWGFIICGTILLLFAFGIDQIDKNFPIVFFIILALVLSITIWWGQKFYRKVLWKFRDVAFKVTKDEISMQGSSLHIRSIPFNKIAIIHETHKGTILVKGNFWTKIDYYRPKKFGHSLDQDDRIFIPKTTFDYKRLIKQIKTLANNGYK